MAKISFKFQDLDGGITITFLPSPVGCNFASKSIFEKISCLTIYFNFAA